MKEYGLEVTHDYATLSEYDADAQTKLYSGYPFPSRKDGGGLTDRFTREAWAALNESPDKPFYRFEQIQSRPMLRYATADLMRQSCVDCHNTHPDALEKGPTLHRLKAVDSTCD